MGPSHSAAIRLRRANLYCLRERSCSSKALPISGLTVNILDSRYLSRLVSCKSQAWPKANILPRAEFLLRTMARCASAAMSCRATASSCSSIICTVSNQSGARSVVLGWMPKADEGGSSGTSLPLSLPSYHLLLSTSHLLLLPSAFSAASQQLPLQ